MRFTTAAAILLIFGSNAPSAAADCDSPRTQREMNAHADADLQASDAGLNATSRAIIGRLRDRQITIRLFTTAEQAWLRFRDAKCTFAASATEGGNVHPMTVTLCKARLTDAREKQLNDYLGCREGDLSCPLPPP